MSAAPRLLLPRRRLVGGSLGLLGGFVLGSGRAFAQDELLVASGTGVNLKMMPDRGGQPTVPLRELFGFDPYYAQCVIEDNPTAFAMNTHAMGRVVVEPHTFFMAMYAHEIGLVSIHETADGTRVARLAGNLGCITEAGTATGRVGSRDKEELASFEIEAVDGGPGGGEAGDRFAFTVGFDPQDAPVNYAMFGPKPTFTGELVEGEITIGPAGGVPLSPATPAATPSA